MNRGAPERRLVQVIHRPSPLVVRLELTSPIDPIAGTLTGPAGTPVAFTGWTGLAAALGSVIEGPTDSDSPEVSHP